VVKQGFIQFFFNGNDPGGGFDIAGLIEGNASKSIQQHAYQTQC